MPGRGAAVLGHFLLDAFKQFLIHNRRHSIWHDDVLETVLPNIAAIGEQGLDAVVSKLLVPVGGHALLIEPVHDLLHGRALIVLFEGFHHKGRFQRVNLKEAVFIDSIPNGDRSTIILTLEDVFGHAADDLL